jgi:hypothetical protein
VDVLQPGVDRISLGEEVRIPDGDLPISGADVRTLGAD